MYNKRGRRGTTAPQLVIGREPHSTARVVPDEQQAWHAGEDNDNTWGIEICQGWWSDGFTDAQMDQVVDAAKHYMALGVPARHAKTSNDPEGGFIGHEETAQGKAGGKSDPGPLFDWDDFITRLKGDDMTVTAAELAYKDWQIARIVATFKRHDYALVEAGPDPATGEPIIEVFSGKTTDDAIRIRVR